jgi:hypothetical protein
MQEIYSLRIRKKVHPSTRKVMIVQTTFDWGNVEDALECKKLLEKASYASGVSVEFVKRGVEEKL